MSVADLKMDLFTREVVRAGQKIELQSREFALLELLLRHAGRPVTKTMILEHVWDFSFDPQTNVVDVLVHRLRSKVDRGFQQRLIHTVRGVGYVVKAKLVGFWQSFAVRLSLLFAATFTVSAVILFALLYLLLTSFFEQSEREIIQARLKECAAVYETRGLPALNDLVHRTEFDQNEGPFFVRVTGPQRSRSLAGGAPGLGQDRQPGGRRKRCQPERLAADSQGCAQRIHCRQDAAQ